MSNLRLQTSGARPRVALIAGPTGSGKSALALDLARAERGTIINADASQVYRDLRVLTARPSVAEEAEAPHRLYGYRDGAQACTAADWAADAKAVIEEVLADGGLPILVGGTGLYLRVLLDGIAPVPAIDPQVRETVRLLDARQAHDALGCEDAAAAAGLHPNDTARNQRALEVIRSTGRSILKWREARAGGIGNMIALDIRPLDPPVDVLNAGLDARAAAMFEQGAVAEVAGLVARGLPARLPILRAIGVQAIRRHLDGAVPLAETIAAVQQETRAYGKRQRTWLRHQLLVDTDESPR